MKQQRVYVDTSVIGGCFDEEFAPWSNGLMEDFRLGLYEPVLSEVVALEILGKAPEHVQQAFDALIEQGAIYFEADGEVEALAKLYLERGILTQRYRDDALHVAHASAHDVPLLVSWNFRHIVHFDKIRLFNALNQEQGYRTIDIRSPRELTHHGPEGKRL